MDIKKLRKIAEEADDGGEWKVGATSVYTDNTSGWRRVFVDEQTSAQNRDHIATFDPPTVIALLDYIDELKVANPQVKDPIKLNFDFESSSSHPQYPVDNYCECNNTSDWTLEVEEGHASLRHSCGKLSWLEPEDLWFEAAVTVTIDTCSNPGGWHGMVRCDCGPEVYVEIATKQPQQESASFLSKLLTRFHSLRKKTSW